jgi:hypothetical protein
MVWDPYRQEDEKGNRMAVATTSRGTSFRPISMAVPTFCQSGKRKISEVDNAESDEAFNVSGAISLETEIADQRTVV